MASADRDGWCDRLAESTGLPVLDGWSPDGGLWSRGVRFANGPFLDIHNPPPDEEPPPPSVLLRGSLAEAETLAGQRSWRFKASRRSDAQPDQASPWSLGYFSRGQGVLSRIGLIEYEVDPATCGNPEYSVPLFALRSASGSGARLDRVWMGVEDEDAAGLELCALGFTPVGEVRAPPDRVGRRFAHTVCDLVLFQGQDGVSRLDISASVRGVTLKLAGLEVVCS